MPLSLREATRPVFHYTSASGLLGLVETGCLWTSEASSLNDLAEVRRGWDIVRVLLDRIPSSAAAERLQHLAEDPLEEKHEVFVLSASTAPDDANQWRLYAEQGHGYAVEMNFETALVAVSDAFPPKRGLWVDTNPLSALHLEESVQVTPWYHVLYSEADVETTLRELEDSYSRATDAAVAAAEDEEDYDVAMADLRGVAYSALATIAHLVKAPGFSGEREVRIVTTYLFADHHIRYRPGPNGVVAYGLLATAPSDHVSGRVLHSKTAGSRPREVKPLPIASVRLGPLLHAEHESTVKRLLRWNDLDTTHVVRSDVLLR